MSADLRARFETSGNYEIPAGTGLGASHDYDTRGDDGFDGKLPMPERPMGKLALFPLWDVI